MKTLVGILVGLCLLAGTAYPVYVEDSIDVGDGAVASLAYNPSAGVIYGCSQSSYYFFAISGDSHKVISRIYRDMPIYVAYAARANKAYFTQRTDDVDSVIVVDGTTHRYLKAIPLLWATVPVYDSVSNRLYVSCDLENEVGVIDCVTDSVIARIHVGSGPVWMDINTLGRKLYTRNDDGESVSIIDLETNTVIRTIRLGGVPSSGCFSASVNKYYCGSSGVHVIDGAGDTVRAYIPLAAGTAVPAMLSVDAHSLVMASGYTGRGDSVFVIDAATDTVVRALPADREPCTLLWSRATDVVYCVRAGCDSVSVIRGDGSRGAGAVSVGLSPFALTLAYEQGRVYLGHLGSHYVYVLRDTVTGVAEPAVETTRRQPLLAANPNPFVTATTIRATSGRASSAGIRVFSKDGALVRRLAPSSAPTGAPATYVWDGRDESGRRVPDGVYIAVFEGQTDGHVKLTKSE